MIARALLLVTAVLIAGCADDEPPVESAAAVGAPLAAAGAGAGATPTADGGLRLPILLEGSTATQVNACIDVAPPCRYHVVAPGVSDAYFEDLTGRVAGGALSLSWTAATPATEELAFGIMVMGGEGEACAPVSLGLLKGKAPLAIDVGPMERAFCGGEILHAWVSNGIYVGQGPAVAQLDVDQAFRLEGNVTLSP